MCVRRNCRSLRERAYCGRGHTCVSAGIVDHCEKGHKQFVDKFGVQGAAQRKKEQVKEKSRGASQGKIERSKSRKNQIRSRYINDIVERKNKTMIGRGYWGKNTEAEE
eukprot:scaffold1114_cov202-Skeletonema_menzelii.AAC.2